MNPNNTFRLETWTVQQIVDGLASGKIRHYTNNPPYSKKGIAGITEKPFSPSAFHGIVMYEQPSGILIIIDGNTRAEFVGKRGDYMFICGTAVCVSITTDREEMLRVLDAKLLGNRGSVSLSYIALNPDMPSGRFLRNVKNKLGSTADLVWRHVEKSPQHIFDIMNHLKDGNGEADGIIYNSSRAHHPATSRFLNAPASAPYREFVGSEWEERIVAALESYAVVLKVHAPRAGQNDYVDKLLGVGKGALNPGFWVVFMLDHMADGRGSFHGFSKQSANRLLQHLYAGKHANALIGATQNFLRVAPVGSTRSDEIRTINRYTR
jgi:hypothetical protein